MRPAILFPLFAPVTALPGVGPRIGKLIALAAGPRVVDLAFHLPAGVIDRRYAPKVAEAEPGRIATMTLRVVAHRPARVARQPYRVVCADETGEIALVFFHARADFLERALPPGETRVVSGPIEDFRGVRQMSHPDYIAKPGETAALPAVEPVYGLTAGLSLKIMGKAVRGALERLPDLAEWLDPAYQARQGWPAWKSALAAAHAPETAADLAPATPARSRLAFDELLANQLALALVRARARRQPGAPLKGDGRFVERILTALPFRLTADQENAVAEIRADLAGPNRMLRLLQGDVGSGKTVVALLAMASAVEAGTQASVMAPTEVLARQHFATIEPLATAAGLKVALLTGREKGRPRDAILAALAAGETDIAIGTHALIEDDVAFRELGLAVIDEQHRFGVHQRLMLAGKGRAHVLVMTATPIPRTLMMTAYGDMDVTRIAGKPPGRRPVDTRTLPISRLAEVVQAVRRAIDRGGKVYWVCPLVEESETLDVAAAEERYAALQAEFGDRVGLVHGRLKASEKDGRLEAFARGPLAILVATTVIEVGVDVPAATVIVIEHAERFGLAQLHQLRGRVGRSDKPSACLLLYAQPLTETAKARLSILRETDDGFRIAEEDLRLRGAGEVLGVRQSGLPAFRFADLAVHGDLLAAARDDARLILGRDAALACPRGQALRTLLYLFERDAAVATIRAG